MQKPMMFWSEDRSLTGNQGITSPVSRFLRFQVNAELEPRGVTAEVRLQIIVLQHSHPKCAQ